MSTGTRGIQIILLLATAIALVACDSNKKSKKTASPPDLDPYIIVFPNSGGGGGGGGSLVNITRMNPGYYELHELVYFHQTTDQAVEFGYNHTLAQPGDLDSSSDQWSAKWFRGEPTQIEKYFMLEFPDAISIQQDGTGSDYKIVTAYLRDYFYSLELNQFASYPTSGGSPGALSFWDYLNDAYSDGKGFYSFEQGGGLGYLLATESSGSLIRLYVRVQSAYETKFLRLTYRRTADSVPY